MVMMDTHASKYLSSSIGVSLPCKYIDLVVSRHVGPSSHGQDGMQAQRDQLAWAGRAASAGRPNFVRTRTCPFIRILSLSATATPCIYIHPNTKCKCAPPDHEAATYLQYNIFKTFKRYMQLRYYTDYICELARERIIRRTDTR